MIQQIFGVADVVCPCQWKVRAASWILRALGSRWATFELWRRVRQHRGSKEITTMKGPVENRSMSHESRVPSLLTPSSPQQTHMRSPGFWRVLWALWWIQRTWETLNPGQDRLCRHSSPQTSPGPECTAPHSLHELETHRHKTADY